MPDPPVPPNGYLDVDRVAQRLDVPATAVQDWHERGLLPRPEVDQDGRPLWSEAAINAWAAQFHRALG